MSELVICGRQKLLILRLIAILPPVNELPFMFDPDSHGKRLLFHLKSLVIQKFEGVPGTVAYGKDKHFRVVGCYLFVLKYG